MTDFTLGVNYWPRRKAMYWWTDFDAGEVREEFSPLLYHLFADYVASYVAERLGRSLFQSDRPALLQSVNEYYASLQRNVAEKRDSE